MAAPAFETTISEDKLRYVGFGNVGLALSALRDGKVDAVLLSSQLVSQISFGDDSFIATVAAPQRLVYLDKYATLSEVGVGSTFADWTGLFASAETSLLSQRAYEYLLALARNQQAWTMFKAKEPARRAGFAGKQLSVVLFDRGGEA